MLTNEVTWQNYILNGPKHNIEYKFNSLLSIHTMVSTASLRSSLIEIGCTIVVHRKCKAYLIC